MSWIIYNIEPNVFNVISDLLALAIVALFSSAVAFVYPYVIWDSLSRGYPIHIEGILQPPNLWESLRLFRNKSAGPVKGQLPSIWVMMILPVVVLAAFLAHTAADSFLDFENVQVGELDTFFLSSQPGGVPSYGFLTGKSLRTCVSTAYPGLPAISLLQQADAIASGVSRFSLYPPDMMDFEIIPLFEGTIELFQYAMHQLDDPTNGLQYIPARLGVECESPHQRVRRPKANIPENATDEEMHFPNGTNMLQILFEMAVTDSGEASAANRRVEYLHQPVCNFETTIKEATINDADRGDGWTILNRMSVNYQDIATWPDSLYFYHPFGMRDRNGDLRWWADFSTEETASICTRENWQLGRRTRDGITLAIGIDYNNSDPDWNWDSPYVVHPTGGVELKTEFSLISGPAESLFADSIQYTLSSWSKECPIWNEKNGKLYTESFPSLTSNATGCVIDLVLLCDSFFPQDSLNLDESANNQMPRCSMGIMEIMTVSGVEVDPGMLAAYAGIGTRNRALNQIYEDTSSGYAVRMNSLAAAYILTRKVVPGTVAKLDVRPIVHAEYIFFMLVPFIGLIPFLYFLLPNKGRFVEKSSLPIPSSTWDIMVLAKKASDTVIKPVDMPTKSACDLRSGKLFPEEPKDVKFGFTSEDSTQEPKLGLGKVFPAPSTRSQKSSSGASSAGTGGATAAQGNTSTGQGNTTPSIPPISKPLPVSSKKDDSSVSSGDSNNSQQVDQTSAVASDSYESDDEKLSVKSGGEQQDKKEDTKYHPQPHVDNWDV